MKNLAKVNGYLVRNILRNLIGKAIKFTFAGGKIEQSARQHENEALIIVADNGREISGSVLEKLFKVDQKLIIPGTAIEKGSDPGLILCKEFVGQQGGKISVQSESGKDPDFILHFLRIEIKNLLRR